MQMVPISSQEMLLLISGPKLCSPSPSTTFGALFGPNLLTRGTFVFHFLVNPRTQFWGRNLDPFSGPPIKNMEGSTQKRGPISGTPICTFLGNNLFSWGPYQVSGNVFCEKEALA